MPHILVAGVVAAKPKAQPFPATGRPRCELRLEVHDDASMTVFRVLGFDDQTRELEMLLPGDSAAIQGQLQVELKDGRLTGMYIVAHQVLPLRQTKRKPGP